MAPLRKLLHLGPVLAPCVRISIPGDPDPLFDR